LRSLGTDANSYSMGSRTGLLLHVVDNIITAVFGAGRFIVAGCFGLFLAETYALHLRFLRAEELHRVLHRVRATLAKRQVVLPAAQFVTVALYCDARAGIGGEVFRVRLD